MKIKRVRHLSQLVVQGFVVSSLLLGASPSQSAPASSTTPHSPCTLPIVVRGTTLLADTPERSFAMIENKETGHTGPYSTAKGKNIVVAKAVLVEIQELAVLIKYEGQIQRCGAAGHTFTDPNADSAAPKSSGSINPTNASLNLNSLEGILQAMAKEMKRHPAGKRDPNQVAYFDWNMQSPKGGGPGPGFKAVALKKDSIYYKLGIRNYDLVHSINGIDIKDPTKAMDYLKALGDSGTLTFDVQRRGKKEIIEVDIASWNK